MKKSILIPLIVFGLFALNGSSVLAQTEVTAKNTTKELSKTEKITIDAILVISKNKSLADADKQKFIKRLQALSNNTKTGNTARFKEEYKRLSNNYKRVTNKTLPTIKKETVLDKK